jgi:hypothetical protein
MRSTRRVLSGHQQKLAVYFYFILDTGIMLDLK